jgi:hypothetical protein
MDEQREALQTEMEFMKDERVEDMPLRMPAFQRKKYPTILANFWNGIRE